MENEPFESLFIIKMKARKSNGNGKKMFLVMSRNNYVLMYE